MIYHLDYVAGFLSLAGMYIVGKKLWWGWVVNLVNLVALVYINCHFALWGFIPVNIIMAVIFAKNTITWYKEAKCQRQSAASTQS